MKKIKLKNGSYVKVADSIYSTGFEFRCRDCGRGPYSLHQAQIHNCARSDKRSKKIACDPGAVINSYPR